MHNNEFKSKFFSLSGMLDVFLPFLFWLSLIFSFGDIPSGILTVCAAAIHEAGHIAFSMFRFGSAELPRAVTLGFRIKKPSSLSYKDEILYAFFGPLFNLIFAASAVFFFGRTNGYAEIFALINLMTALSNLLPIETYDGYRMLYCIFCSLKHEERLLALLSRFSSLLVGLLTFVSLYLMLRFGSGYWIFAVFSFTLISNISRKLKKRIF